MFLFVGAHAFAYEPDIKILTQEEMVKLPEKELLDAYIDTSVEIQAAKTFHTTSGFLPKEYRSFKNLLRYRILLINEIKKRKLEVPQVE